jgi:hypothetical protein
MNRNIIKIWDIEMIDALLTGHNLSFSETNYSQRFDSIHKVEKSDRYDFIDGFILGCVIITAYYIF